MKLKFWLTSLVISLTLSTAAHAEWVDITPSVELSQSKLVLDRVNKVQYSYVAIKNSSGTAITGPVYLKITNPSVPVTNATGLSEDFQNYFELTEDLPTGVTKTVRVNFQQSRTAVSFGVQLAKSGYVMQTFSGSTYNPPAESRYITQPKSNDKGLFHSYVEGSFIVWFKQGVTQNQIQIVSARIGATIQGHISGTQEYFLTISKRGFSFSQMNSLLDEVKGFDEVDDVKIDLLLSGKDVHAHGYYSIDSDNQYYLQGSGVVDAWNYMNLKSTSETLIGVVDTLLTNNHQDLDVENISDACSQMSSLSNCILTVKNSIHTILDINPHLKNENQNHGTLVTGVIGATHNGKGVSGIMPRKKILFARGSIEGQGNYSNSAIVDFRIHQLLELNAKIINTSFGKGSNPEVKATNDGGPDVRFCAFLKSHDQYSLMSDIWLQQATNQATNGDCKDDFLDNPSNPYRSFRLSDFKALNSNLEIDSSIQNIKLSPGAKFYEDLEVKFQEKDYLFIAAAGNSNEDAFIERNICGEKVEVRKKHGLCVAALEKTTDSNNPDRLFASSNYGPVDIATYGDKIFTTNEVGNYMEVSGTSFAAPIITGITGLIWNTFPDLKASQVRESLINGLGRYGATSKTDCVTDGVVSGQYVTHEADPNHKIPVANAYCALKYAELLANKNKNNGLVAHYCFDDPNNLGKDCSTSGNHGSPRGSVSATTGITKGAALFGGYYAPGSIRVPNSPSLVTHGELSVSFWVKQSSLYGMNGYGSYSANAAHSVFAKSHDRIGFALNLGTNSSTNQITPYVGSYNWSGPAVAKTETVVPNTWNHVVYVFSNQNRFAKLFINGNLRDATFAFSAPNAFAQADAQDLYIGQFSSFWYPFNGAIDEMRVYNRALSDTEAKLLFQQP